MVSAGVKPAGTLDYHSGGMFNYGKGDNVYMDSAGVYRFQRKFVEQTVRTLENFGLFYSGPHYSIGEDSLGLSELLCISFANTEEGLSRLIYSQNSEELGLALGYPPLNVLYFSRKISPPDRAPIALEPADAELITMVYHKTEMRDY